MWPKIPSGFVRAVLAGHSSLGLFFAAAMYLVCLSGTLVVFHRELHQWEQPVAPGAETVSDEAMVASLAALTEHATQFEHVHGLNVVAPSASTPWLTPRFYTDDGYSEDWIADPETGALIAKYEAPFSEFLSSLHIYLRLPNFNGIYIVGLIGVAMLSLIISGILSHPRIFKDAFALRWGGGKRLQEADLHNRLSVWALPFHLMISFTGAFLGLAYFVVGILALVAFEGDQTRAIRAVLGPQATEDETAAPPVEWAALIADARERMNGGEVVYLSVEHPGTMGQMIAIDIAAPRDLAASESFFYDATGSFVERSGYSDGEIGKQALAAFTPLHFGTFGGLPVKLAYLVFGLASTVVAASGVTIWLARRRDRGRPAARWERIWSASVWGGALGCATPGLVTPFAPNIDAATWAFLATVIAALGASLVMPSALAVSRVLRALLALTLVLLAALNVSQHGGLALSGAPLAVNVALILAAAVLILSFSPVRRLAPLGDRQSPQAAE